MFVVQTNAAKTFEFEIDGKRYEVVSINSMDTDTALAYAKAARSGDDFLFLEWLLDNIFTGEAREAVGKLALDQIRDLVSAYLQDAKVTPGESKA